MPPVTNTTNASAADHPGPPTKAKNAPNAAPPIDPTADNNWRILPVPGVQLRFTSGSGALPHLPRYPQIKLIKDNGDGSALFELAP